MHQANGEMVCIAVVPWDFLALIPPFPLNPHNFALNYLGLYLVFDSLPLLLLPDLAQRMFPSHFSFSLLDLPTPHFLLPAAELRP